MALTNHERIGKALELLKEGLVPFVERELKAQHAQLWFEQAKASVSELQADLFGTQGKPRWDAAALLIVIWNQWNEVFRKTLGQAERTLVSELREVRNKWAHQQTFSSDDAYRSRLREPAAGSCVRTSSRRGREDEDGAPPPALRRAGA